MYIHSKLSPLKKTFFQLDTSCIEKEAFLKQERFALNGKWGNAKSHIVYGNCFAVIKSEFQAAIDLSDIFSVKGEYVQLACFISGEPNFVDALSQKQSIELGLVQLFYARDNTFTVHLNAPKKAEYLCLLLERDFFLKLFQNKSWFKNQPFYREVNERQIQELRRQVFPLNFTSYTLINELFSNTLPHPFNYGFLELRIKEIFLTLLANSSPNKSRGAYSEMSEVTQEKIKKAHRYLTLNFKKTPKVKELARIVLLNELQLKKGFKEVYGGHHTGLYYRIKNESRQNPYPRLFGKRDRKSARL